jgi:hypothetical protein
MARCTLGIVFAILLAAAWAAASGSQAAAAASGHGRLRFRVLHTASFLPPEARKVLPQAHGGFAVDQRPGRGEIYFALKGAGILQISADLSSARLLETPEELKSTNLHNTTIWYAPSGAAYLSFAANEAGRIYTTSLEGKLVHALPPPAPGTDLGHPAVNDYFAGAGNFVPTDIAELEGWFYITTGYSNLDFVLTARLHRSDPVRIEWSDLAFGGRGSAPGQFGTGHGIAVPPGTRFIEVADRPNSKIERFTRYGQYVGSLKMPAGSLPCDIFYSGGYAVVPALDGPDRSKGAPIYILENGKLASTILPKEELGLSNFRHVHHAVLVERKGKLYLITQAWNPGDFAILEQIAD